MRYIAPERAELDASVFQHPVFAALEEQYAALCVGADWPDVQHLNHLWQAPINSQGLNYRFVAQESISDQQHYEQRIFDQAIISTRSQNWHDLFNAMIWMKFPKIKAALNARQVQDIAESGSKQRTRSQCAMTHFDEAGAIIRLADSEMLGFWNEHDWPAFFGAWPHVAEAGGIQVWLFGHSIYEHALNPDIALVAKAIVLDSKQSIKDLDIDQWLALRIIDQHCLMDPQELRPIPLSGIPFWHPWYGQSNFFQRVPCFQPKRAGKMYPKPLTVQY